MRHTRRRLATHTHVCVTILKLQQHKMSFTFTLTAALTLIVTSAVTTTTHQPTNNAIDLLFYTCVTKQIGNQCEEGFTLDQAGIATRGFSSNFTTIQRGKRLANITTLFAVHDTFFQNNAGLRKGACLPQNVVLLFTTKYLYYSV